ncbi:DUF3667 domain-containing protein [Paraflavitalea speifideaquila]|uniref:DUF3667 domain-containing protein n=1 Tax=Paraflavitalea speifideaquila TaxID=3076558 RepID=UPI003312FA33
MPQEYIKGRRARYLHPIRMYVFSSAMFFIIFLCYSSPRIGSRVISILMISLQM